MDKLCISSLVVRTKPEALASVQAAIESIAETEIPGKHEDGRLVVVIDATDNRRATDIITDIQNMADVLSATLIYQFDDQNEPHVEATL